jgi:hypothetical protein
VDYPIGKAKLHGKSDGVKPKTAVGMLSELPNQANLFRLHSVDVRSILGASQRQFKIVSPFLLDAQAKFSSVEFSKTISRLLTWSNTPRVKSELFMYRKSATAEKFSKLVAIPLERLILVLNSFFEFSDLNKILPITQKRARIMSIRGLALSCAPNFTPSSDVKTFSRSSWGSHNSLVA